MQPAGPAGCDSPPDPMRRLATAWLPELATSTLRPSRLTTTSSGERRARAGAQPSKPARLMQPAVPSAWVTVPSAARRRTATALGDRLLATNTRLPSELTATATGSFSARPSVHPPSGNWLMHPAAPPSWRSVPVRRLRANTASARLADAAT